MSWTEDQVKLLAESILTDIRSDLTTAKEIATSSQSDDRPKNMAKVYRKQLINVVAFLDKKLDSYQFSSYFAKAKEEDV